ncbi:GNAT domain [Dillenia turbinata]|uniref:N-alpha-acetyltransferase 60 n=1 Tax=Dillenia turbinata TaxID=194707 RepID=A0AAN8VM26_9MAGN
MPHCSMVDLKASFHSTISYRPIRPSDLEILEKIHGDIFPIRYESEFFLNVVNGYDIVSWGAVDLSRPDDQRDELIGFVTARIILARDSEIADFIRPDSSESDQTLVYILTLGVIETYRNLGIASSLIREVIKYARSISSCRAVYLHVISYNNAAICLYEKMSFKCIRKLHDFYYINGQHYDSFLFVYFINGGRSPCSPLELVTCAISYMRSGLKSLAARLWKNEDKKESKWTKCKEAHCLITKSQNRRILSTEGAEYQCV